MITTNTTSTELVVIKVYPPGSRKRSRYKRELAFKYTKLVFNSFVLQLFKSNKSKINKVKNISC